MKTSQQQWPVYCNENNLVTGFHVKSVSKLLGISKKEIRDILCIPKCEKYISKSDLSDLSALAIIERHNKDTTLQHFGE